MTGGSGWPAGWPWRGGGGAAASGGGVVATTDRLASEVGVETLRSGGNAVDATVAVAFALAVVNPEAGNLGGSGFLVLRTPDGALAALDHRSTAPAAATADMFVDARGQVTEDVRIGMRSVAVPGTVRGLADAWERFGTLPWPLLVEPAIELARGFTVTKRFIRSFDAEVLGALRRFPESTRIFLPGGEPPRPGEIFRQPDLARTLERIRDRGADGFYRGETADLIVADMERRGGLVTHEDLAGYRSVWREPVRFGYRGRTVVSMPPPSSGGLTLALIAGMLEAHDLGRLPWHGARHVHLLAEAWKRAYADRNESIADPDRVDVPADVLASHAYAAWRGRDIGDVATPSAAIAPGVEAWREDGATTHVSIVDGKGGAAAFTTTVNTWYGSKVVAEGTGVLLNNEMDDFTAKPGVPNYFGLIQGEANAIAPGKRMLSAMTPTLVLDPDGELEMVVGTPGGSTIITTVFQVMSNVVDHGMGLTDAVDAPRVHHQHLPDVIRYEEGGLLPGVLEELGEMRHETSERDEPSGDVQAIVRAENGAAFTGYADPRRGGVALAV